MRLSSLALALLTACSVAEEPAFTPDGGSPGDGGIDDAGAPDAGPLDCSAVTLRDESPFDCTTLDDDDAYCALVQAAYGGDASVYEKIGACGACDATYFVMPESCDPSGCGDVPAGFPNGYCLPFCGSDVVMNAVCVDGQRACTDEDFPQLGDDCPEGSY